MLIIYAIPQDTSRLEYLIPKKTSLRHRLPMGDQGFVDFVSHLLEVNPKKRPSASEALKHPWLSYPYEPISAWTDRRFFMMVTTCWRFLHHIIYSFWTEGATDSGYIFKLIREGGELRRVAACLERRVWFSLMIPSPPHPWQVVLKFHHNCNFSGSVFLGFFFIHLVWYGGRWIFKSCCTWCDFFF